MDHSVALQDDSAPKPHDTNPIMHILIIMAHGSRREESNQEVSRLAERLRPRLADYDRVTHAFLELANPNLNHAARTAIDEGATTLTVFPYFLVAGRHVAEDIPAQVEGLRSEHPDITINLLSYLGNGTAMDELVAAQLNAAPEGPGN